MGRLESDIRQAAADLIYRELGITHSNLRAWGETGLPDHLYWLPLGKPLLIEFKRPGEPLSAKQEDKLSWLKSLGYDVAVCDSALDALWAAITALEARTLPKAQRAVLARARRSWALLGPRAPQD